MSGLRLAAVSIPGDPEHWAPLGFTVDGHGRVAFANGALVFGAELAGLLVDGAEDLPDHVDGVPIGRCSVVPGTDHSNGAFELDHVVLMTNSLDRTSGAIEAALGLEQRRIRETTEVRQGFHRFADQGGGRGCIVEVVENARAQQTALWGLVVNVRDLDVMNASAGDLIGEPKPAVQPGRSIATVRSAAGLGTALAVMSVTDGR